MNEAKREPAPKLVFTPEEAAERLTCGRTTVYALLASGELASVRIGRLRRIPAAVLDQYIERLLRAELDQCTPRKARRPTRADDHASGRDPAIEKLLEELGVSEVRT